MRDERRHPRRRDTARRAVARCRALDTTDAAMIWFFTTTRLHRRARYVATDPITIS
ncbi:MAG: hypothetical protein ACYDB2_04085 [Acidimicrobiales bacterium]